MMANACYPVVPVLVSIVRRSLMGASCKVQKPPTRQKKSMHVPLPWCGFVAYGRLRKKLNGTMSAQGRDRKPLTVPMMIMEGLSSEGPSATVACMPVACSL